MKSITECINQFRLASRELFNHFFRVPNPYENDGWLLEERFSVVQALLFDKIVVEPTGLAPVEYGSTQPEITVVLRDCERAPIFINRDVNIGYWDYPIKEVSNEARLLFISFFDWDQLDYRDNRYVRVEIESWPQHPDTVGKHALIESQYVRFEQESHA